MDDSIILATWNPHQAVDTKLHLLRRSTDELRCIIHKTKSCFIAMNSTDTYEFRISVVAHTDNCAHLGTPITARPLLQHVKDDKHSKPGMFWNLHHSWGKTVEPHFMWSSSKCGKVQSFVSGTVLCLWDLASWKCDNCKILIHGFIETAFGHLQPSFYWYIANWAGHQRCTQIYQAVASSFPFRKPRKRTNFPGSYLG